MKRIQAFQVLRVFAMLVVFLNHFFIFYSDTLYVSGRFGVSFFFLMSSYFLVKSTKSTKNYWTKKFCKLIPLYYLLSSAIFIILFYWPTLLPGKKVNITSLIYTFLFIPFSSTGVDIPTPILDVGWTLVIEMFVYFIFWICYCFFKKSDKAAIASIGIILSLITINKVFDYNIPFIRFYGMNYMLYFVYGFIIAILELRLTTKHKLNMSLMKKWEKCEFNSLAVILIFLLFVCVATVFKENYFSIAFVSIFFACIVLWGEKWTFPRWVCNLSKISYSFYLLHYYVYRFIDKALFSHVDTANAIFMLVELIVVFIVVLICSYVSWYIFEEKLFKKITNRLYLIHNK